MKKKEFYEKRYRIFGAVKEMHEQLMRRCISLAMQGMGKVAPNPLVGCVIVHEGKVISEGYHTKFGAPHAEAEAIRAVTDPELLKNSTLYVNLEPCSHTGKTPPCADLIIKMGIPRVVVGCIDPNPKVAGNGIRKLIDAGIEVKTGVLEKECEELNKRFITAFTKSRPYIILKWAQSADGFIDRQRKSKKSKPAAITGDRAQKINHLWRSHEQAIMVGTQTALMDNPQLTTRLVNGSNPLRITIDLDDRLPSTLHLFDGSSPTLVYTTDKKRITKNLEFHPVSEEQNILLYILQDLHRRGIHSVIVEGGRKLLRSFQKSGLWDEIRVFISPKKLNEGIEAPVPDGLLVHHEIADGDLIRIYRNPESKE